MKQRAFAKQPGQIRFTEDFHEQTRGALLPGQPISLEFADSRIPDEPTGAARIEAWVQFDGGQSLRVPLALSHGWRDLDPALTEPGEGNLWTGTFTPPVGASEMSIWFVKTGPSGQRYYDSRFGENYWFRFTGDDLNVLDATVDAAGFHVEVEAATDVTSLEAHYQVLNAELAPGVVALSQKGPVSSGMNKWAGSAPLHRSAVVSFKLVYTAGGRTYTDDNQRRGYLAPDPEPILAAQRTALAERKG
jgi:hypothetical protein